MNIAIVDDLAFDRETLAKILTDYAREKKHKFNIAAFDSGECESFSVNSLL